MSAVDVRAYLTDEVLAQVDVIAARDPEPLLAELVEGFAQLTDRQLSGLYYAATMIVAGIDGAARRRGL